MKKVSVLVPCYNVEKYISTFLDSLIAQNYSPIELILVNDGSTDKTESIIFSYFEKLKANDIEPKYFYKENGGLASAIGFGIKYITGEYFIWVDPDDILLHNHILKKVNYMEEHPNCAIARCNGYVYNQVEAKCTGVITKLRRKTYIEDFLNFTVPWSNGCYIIRVSCLDEMNPKRIIPDFPTGQNMQIILPIVYKYPCEYFDEYLFQYNVFPNSHSRSVRDYDGQKQRITYYEECGLATLDLINGNTEIHNKILKSFIRKTRYTTAWTFGNKKDLEIYKSELEQHKELDFRMKIMKHFKPSKISKFVIRVISFVKRGVLNKYGK